MLLGIFSHSVLNSELLLQNRKCDLVFVFLVGIPGEPVKYLLYQELAFYRQFNLTDLQNLHSVHFNNVSRNYFTVNLCFAAHAKSDFEFCCRLIHFSKLSRSSVSKIFYLCLKSYRLTKQIFLVDYNKVHHLHLQTIQHANNETLISSLVLYFTRC